jgi:CheY-like chemotaxis protein
MNSASFSRKHPIPVVVTVHRPCLRTSPTAPRDGSESAVGQVVADAGEWSVIGTVGEVDETIVSRLPRAIYTMHTVVLADDHPVVRQSLKRLLAQQADLHLVGESGNGLETLHLVKQLQPDLLVTDLMMPGMNGLEVTRRIRLSFPATRVVVVSVNGDEPYVAGALRCGADGFVLKTACGRHLLSAVRAVLAGKRFVSPPLNDPTL